MSSKFVSLRATRSPDSPKLKLSNDSDIKISPFSDVNKDLLESNKFKSKEELEDEIKKYISKVGDPKVFGPGEWWRLGEDAYWARTKEEIDVFIKGLPRRFRGLPCAKCRENALKYLAENSPERYRHLREGMFRWVYEFHNYKNKELGKPEITYEQAITPHRALEFPEQYNSEACDYCTEKIPTSGSETKPKSPRVLISK